MDGDGVRGRAAEAKALDRERFALKDDPFPAERPAQKIQGFAHARGRAGEAATVPELHDRLRPGADAQTETARRQFGHACRAHRQGGRPARIYVGDCGAEPQPGRLRQRRQRSEAVDAVDLHRPRVGIARGLGLPGDLDVFRQAELLQGHGQRPAFSSHARFLSVVFDPVDDVGFQPVRGDRLLGNDLAAYRYAGTVSAVPDTSGCHHARSRPSATRRYAHECGSQPTASTFPGVSRTHSGTSRPRSA